MSVKRGISAWISSFITVLSILYSSYITILFINEGPNSTVNPYILGSIITGLSTETYLWISIILTFIFLGITCLIVFRKQPPNPEIVKMLLKVGGNLATLRRIQEASTTEITDQMEYNRKDNFKFFNTITKDLEEGNKTTLDLFANQEEVVKKVRSDLISAIGKKLAKTETKTAGELKKQEVIINSIKRLSEEDTATLKTYGTALEEIKLKLEGIEGTMVSNKANLKSLDNPEDIKGIGPSLGKELRTLGINSVGEFLITDPLIIGEKTRVSQEMAKNLQAMAQLMMVPGLDAKKAELLTDAGINSRQQLANQDLIQLSRKVSEIAKIHIEQGKISQDEQPTIEEISSWIRMSR